MAHTFPFHHNSSFLIRIELVRIDIRWFELTFINLPILHKPVYPELRIAISQKRMIPHSEALPVFCQIWIAAFVLEYFSSQFYCFFRMFLCPVRSFCYSFSKLLCSLRFFLRNFADVKSTQCVWSPIIS